MDPAFERVDEVFDHLHGALRDLFPAVGDARVTHRWGGPLGVARDWHATASYNPKTGVGFAGGYVGDGLSTTNLAGRTLADLVLGRDIGADARCPGRTTGRRSGSPNRCASSARTSASSACSSPTSRSASPGARR